MLAVAFPDRYGAGRVFLAAVETMLQAGVSVTVCVPESGPMVKDLETMGVRVLECPYHVLRKGDLRPGSIFRLLWKTPREILRLKRVLLTSHSDALYVNGLPFASWFAAGRLARIPVLGHLHEAEDQLPKLVAVLLTLPMNAANLVVANSQHSARWLAGLQPRLQRRTRVIYNGFKFPAACPQETGPHSPCRILVLSRINARKGQDVVLRAVRQLVDRGHQIHLRIVGAPFRGYERVFQSLQELARELEVLANVTFVGEVPDPHFEFQAADIVVVPSLIESFGNVAVEAMAHARPVIASRISGLSEIVQHEVSGLLCEPGNAEDFAKAIERLLNDRPYARQLARTGFSSAKKRFEMERFSNEFSQVLEKLTN